MGGDGWTNGDGMLRWAVGGGGGLEAVFIFTYQDRRDETYQNQNPQPLAILSK